MTNTPNHRTGHPGSGLPVDALALREALAQIEHEQWRTWSRALAESETLSEQCLGRWRQRWVPYAGLSEPDKDLDREYADQVIDLLVRLGILPAEAQGAEPRSG